MTRYAVDRNSSDLASDSSYANSSSERYSNNFPPTILLPLFPVDYKFDLNEGEGRKLPRCWRKEIAQENKRRMFVCHWYAFACAIIGNMKLFHLEPKKSERKISFRENFFATSIERSELIFNIFLNSIRSHNPDCTCFPPHCDGCTEQKEQADLWMESLSTHEARGMQFDSAMLGWFHRRVQGCDEIWVHWHCWMTAAKMDWLWGGESSFLKKYSSKLADSTCQKHSNLLKCYSAPHSTPSTNPGADARLPMVRRNWNYSNSRGFRNSFSIFNCVVESLQWQTLNLLSWTPKMKHRGFGGGGEDDNHLLRNCVV